MTESELSKIEIAENHACGLITYGGVATYNDLIDQLVKRMTT